MHASTPELLNLRDGAPIDAPVAQHIADCARCARELRLLSQTRERLQSLPPLDAPPDAWNRIQQEAPRVPARGLTRRRLGVAAALAALAIVVGLSVRDERDASIALNTASTTVVEVREPVAAFIAHSQELEQVLQALPQRPVVERVSTAATIDTIEQRIQWLDFQLTHAPEGSFDEAQTRRLWRERVELMDSLVKVRYAEAERLSF